jgi:hypothetical protein
VFRFAALSMLFMCVCCAVPAQPGTPDVDRAPSAAQSSVDVVFNRMTRESLVADAVDSVTIAIAIRNEPGESLANMPIEVEVSGSRNIVTPAATTITDGNGVAILNLTSTKAENKAVSVIANPGPEQVLLDAQPVVTIVAGAAIGFTARDFFDNPVE